MMQIAQTGSMALNYICPSHRKPRDADCIMSYEDFKEFKLSMCTINECYPIERGKKFVMKTDVGIFEIEIAWEGSTAEEFLRLVQEDRRSHKVITDDAVIWLPSIEALYAMKMSHRYLRNSPHFVKTLTDIGTMRAILGASEIDPFWKAWFTRREAETYDYSHPNLAVAKNDFFKDEGFYKYDHDDIHEAIKLGDIPAYKRIIADGEQVRCDVDKWNCLSTTEKLHCALEECYTLALERMLIPNEFKHAPKKAFDVALMKVCTSITSGWFREWCWENYHLIQEFYSETYVVKYLVSLARGEIRNFDHDRK